MPLISDDDPGMPDLIPAPEPLVVGRPSVRLSSTEAEVGAAIYANMATRPLMASSSSVWYVIYTLVDMDSAGGSSMKASLMF